LPAKARELATAARRTGFVFQRQTGSHAFFKHPDGRRVSIPMHGDRDIGGGLYFAILKQLGITEEEFRELR
jgi:predicted RNA binding protein YcfA (HicA-like mRNA interferase family)